MKEIQIKNFSIFNFFFFHHIYRKRKKIEGGWGISHSKLVQNEKFYI